MVCLQMLCCLQEEFLSSLDMTLTYGLLADAVLFASCVSLVVLVHIPSQRSTMSNCKRIGECFLRVATWA